VIAFAGKPESEVRGRYSDNPPFDALGYGCKGRPAASKDGVPGCETVFYLDSKTERLAILDTLVRATSRLTASVLGRRPQL
jgi:hypothetical protein